MLFAAENSRAWSKSTSNLMRSAMVPWARTANWMSGSSCGSRLGSQENCRVSQGRKRVQSPPNSACPMISTSRPASPPTGSDASLSPDTGLRALWGADGSNNAIRCRVRRRRMSVGPGATSQRDAMGMGPPRTTAGTSSSNGTSGRTGFRPSRATGAGAAPERPGKAARNTGSSSRGGRHSTVSWTDSITRPRPGKGTESVRARRAVVDSITRWPYRDRTAEYGVGVFEWGLSPGI